MFQRAAVIGCPGGGKSTFSKRLRDLTGLPLYHLDLLWHKPDRTNVTREEFDCALKRILRQEQWIIDGNYQRTMEARLRACDAVFLLDYPLEVCLAGAKARIGRERDDMPWVEMELDEEFRQWILNFPKDTLPKIYALLERYREEKEIVVFQSREEADRYLNALRGLVR